VAVWATDSFAGAPAGLVHRNLDDSYGRPHRPACVAIGRFFYLAGGVIEASRRAGGARIVTTERRHASGSYGYFACNFTCTSPFSKW
jgi:hypothetical protein